MTEQQRKQHIQAALHAFKSGTLRHNALALCDALGYRSDRTLELEPNTAHGFQDTFDLVLAPQRALTDEWVSADVLFQLTDADMHHQQAFSSDSYQTVDNAHIESYLFFAIHLRGNSYTRTQLATITREVNKHFPMPILILFQHGQTLTISIINRRLHKRDASKDVLEKVTLIKDIHTVDPHRAHLDILYDLSLPTLALEHAVGNFVEVQRAWDAVLDCSTLNKRFYRDIADWYFWATRHVTFPEGGDPDVARRNDTGIIRLITRLMFVWFVKEKGLIPTDLFNEQKLKELLADMSPDASSYYKAIVQNLFFATLNQEMGKREFRKKHAAGGRDQNRLVTTLYRYQDSFNDGGDAQMLALMRNIPFLNGGLFECLDYEGDENRVVRIDGFSDEQKNPLAVPNFLFFADEREVDLNATYETKGKRYKVRGLIRILNRYKFTVTENTPIEEEIALDPELLGQVFENLLAAYNPETGATARKQTGSFYTPREIVNYMVDESLLAYLSKSVGQASSLSEGGAQASSLSQGGGRGF
jgi:adenine-specific DNA-methyltransferase